MPASDVRRLEERVRKLERLLGRKTMEVEILKGGLDRSHAQKKRFRCRALRLRTVPDEGRRRRARRRAVQHRGARQRQGPKRGPQTRDGDLELAAEIRRFVDQRPTYGYRRIAALIKRERRSGGGTPVNAKRVYRLMKKHGLMLARHTGRRRPREHDGRVVTLRSNVRWCSDSLEFTCWNGELVRVAFALDCHDREVIGWVATTAGISGEMIRDLMVECVECPV